MEEARRHAALEDTQDEQKDTIRALRQHAIEHSKIPEWCFPHEHPLKSGLPGKLYDRVDYITPVVDSMKRMQERSGQETEDAFGVFHVPRKRRKVEAPKHSFSQAPGGYTHWTCPVCGNNDQSTWHVYTDRTSCDCGVVVFMGSVVHTHREKLGALQDDDKTQHADAVVNKRTDKYDRSAPSKEERKLDRSMLGKATCLPGKRL
jgi:hypothetical protein